MDSKTLKEQNRLAWLRHLVKENGGTAQFVRSNTNPAAKKQLSENYINQLLNGHRAFGERAAANMEISAGLPTGFFDSPFVDEGALLQESMSQAAAVFGDGLFEPEPGYVAFDLLDVKASAGDGYQPTDHPEVINKVHVLESWAKSHINVDLSRIKVITARGTSMQGTIENGDVLFVDATVRAYDGDGIYVIARGNDIQAKRLQKLNGDVLAIISDNRAYESERLTGADADSIVICGRVLAAWTIRKFW